LLVFASLSLIVNSWLDNVLESNQAQEFEHYTVAAIEETLRENEVHNNHMEQQWSRDETGRLGRMEDEGPTNLHHQE